jgi:NAD(P)-dependent dehydrogenase (short-subunit alcohol dehydrogenase family)
MGKQNPRIVLVTGASSGIGKACAWYLAARGFRVYGTSRHALQTHEDIFSLSPVPDSTVTMLRMDVTDDASVESAVKSVVAREGKLHILLNNAGMGLAGPVESTSIEEAKTQLEVNFFGALRVCRAVLPVMREQRNGYILNVGSIGGLIAIPYQALYSASKFALEGLSEALRLEVSSFGIRVVLIEPGDHKTAFTENRQLIRLWNEPEIYRGSFKTALDRMAHDEQNGPDAQSLAALVHRIVTRNNPRLRYTAGPASQRAAVWVKRLLPNAVLERAMRMYYGLGR